MKIELDIPLSKEEIAYATKAKLNKKANKDKYIYSICTNSKEACENSLFIALSTGHLYLSDAKKKGAATLADIGYDADFNVLSSIDALLDLSAYYKGRLKNLKTTVAITGSVGKTTTKEILSQILSYRYSVHSTYKNFNNEIGLPLSLLSAKKETEILVLEMGMNHTGEIGRLSEKIKPDMAIITNIGNAHIGNLGSRENIAKAKLEITRGMKEAHIIVPYGEKLLITDCKTTTFSSVIEDADFSLKNIKETDGGFLFDIKTPSGITEDISLSLPGKHHLSAVISAIATAYNLEFNGNDIKNSTKTVNRNILRDQLIPLGRFNVYDDSYSSSPEAAAATLEMIASRYKNASCVLGDMLELGEKSKEMHRYIGKIAATLNYKRIYALGTYADNTALGAIDAGMNRSDVYVYKNGYDEREIAEEIIKNTEDGETVLFKASHTVHIDRVYKKIQEITENKNA